CGLTVCTDCSAPMFVFPMMIPFAVLLNDSHWRLDVVSTMRSPLWMDGYRAIEGGERSGCMPFYPRLPRRERVCRCGCCGRQNMILMHYSAATRSMMKAAICCVALCRSVWHFSCRERQDRVRPRCLQRYSVRYPPRN